MFIFKSLFYKIYTILELAIDFYGVSYCFTGDLSLTGVFSLARVSSLTGDFSLTGVFSLIGDFSLTGDFSSMISLGFSFSS